MLCQGGERSRLCMSESLCGVQSARSKLQLYGYGPITVLGTDSDVNIAESIPYVSGNAIHPKHGIGYARNSSPGSKLSGYILQTRFPLFSWGASIL